MPHYFSIICEALGCLSWLFPARWVNIYGPVKTDAFQFGMTLGTLIYKFYSTGLFALQFADVEGVQHSCCVDCLIKNLTNVIPAIPPAMQTAVFGNMEHCVSSGVGETISLLSLTNHFHSCQIVDWSFFIAVVCNY